MSRPTPEQIDLIRLFVAQAAPSPEPGSLGFTHSFLLGEAHDSEELAEFVLALLAELDATSEALDELRRLAALVAPNEADALLAPTLKCAGPTADGKRSAAWILTSCVRILFAEMQHSPPHLRNRLTVGIATHGSDKNTHNLTLAKGDWESLMESQRDEARRERDALVVERDTVLNAAEAYLEIEGGLGDQEARDRLCSLLATARK